MRCDKDKRGSRTAIPLIVAVQYALREANCAGVTEEQNEGYEVGGL